VPQPRHWSRVTDNSLEQTGQVEITSRAILPSPLGYGLFYASHGPR
jgi:hypothetical protein